MTEVKQILTPIEAINEFYRLKDKYENEYYTKYVKPIIKSNKNKREKRVDFSRLPKHPCINCKRNVGTIFNIKSNTKEYLRHFSVKCGDSNDPCPLDIQIDYSFRNSFDSLIHTGLKDIEEIKLNIIKEKNNALFFNKQVMDNFEKLTADLKFNTEDTGTIIETNIIKNNNPEKKNLLKKTIDEFGIACILPFKQMIQEYIDTNNELLLNQAIKFYVNEMIPKLKEIQELKYEVNFIEYEQTENDDTENDDIEYVYKLIQFTNSLQSSEFYFESIDKVIKFVKGVKKDKKTKTMKVNDSELSSKNKTRKIRPVNDFIIEDEEMEIVEPNVEPNFEVEVKPVPE